MTRQEIKALAKTQIKGNIGILFVLGLSFIGWMLLSVFTFGIALIYVIPYMETTMANYYQTIKRPVELD